MPGNNMKKEVGKKNYWCLWIKQDAVFSFYETACCFHCKWCCICSVWCLKVILCFIISSLQKRVFMSCQQTYRFYDSDVHAEGCSNRWMIKCVYVARYKVYMPEDFCGFLFFIDQYLLWINLCLIRTKSIHRMNSFKIELLLP